MKKVLFSILVLAGIFLFLITGCTSTATPETQSATAITSPMQESSPTEAALPTATPASAETMTPTATPEPIPCTITFDSDRDGNLEIYRMAPDGSDTVNLTNHPGDDFDPVWSPDGSQIAFVSNRVNDSGDGQFIYVMNADGSDIRQLTFENWSNWPDWSHDGSQITYTSNDDIFVIQADGSGQSVNLTNSPEKDVQSTWSPDGNHIAWLSGDGQSSNIFVMNTDGSNIYQITDNGQVFSARWTVDGRILTGWGWSDQEEFCYNCVVNADGTNIVDAGGKGQLRRYFPFWTLDGNQVECGSISFDESANEIYLIADIFPDMLLNLTNNPADDRNEDWPANCGQRPMLIGYAGDDPSQQQRKDNFQRATDELGILYVYGGLSELVEQNVTAIVLNSINGRVQEKQEDIQSAIDKGIPVFLLDAELDMNGVYSITIDQREWAKISLEWMFEKIGGEGQIAYFDVYPDYGHIEAINEMLSKYPGITVIDHREGEGFDPGGVKPVTADFVKMYPELKAVWTNANMQGAIQGVAEESGAPIDKWPILVCEATANGLGDWLRARETNPNFDCIAAGNPPGIAYDAVYAAYYLLTGAQIDESVLGGLYGNSLYVEIPIVTSDNLQEWLDINSSVDQKMMPEEIKEKWFLD